MFAGPQGTNILPMTEKQIDRFINSKKSTVQSNDEKKMKKNFYIFVFYRQIVSFLEKILNCSTSSYTICIFICIFIFML